MENLIGLTLCIIAAAVSKRSTLPIIICCYYAAYFILASGYIPNPISAGVQETSSNDALYSTYLALRSAVVAVLLVCATSRTGRPLAMIAYGFVNVAYMLPDAGMLLAPSNGMVSIHSTFQEFAVTIDILFAWLGSDNGLSTRAFSYLRARGTAH